MSNTSAHALLKDIWGDRKFPVDPVWIANELGLDVVETTLDDDVSGALLKEPEQDPVIILNRNDSNVRKRFTCAHELGITSNELRTVSHLNMSLLITAENWQAKV